MGLEEREEASVPLEECCRKDKRRIWCAERLQKEKVLCVDQFGSSGVSGYLFDNFNLNH